MAAAAAHWAARSCRRALAHWRFFAFHARQLGAQLPSSPSSCSGCWDAGQHGQQQMEQEPLLSPPAASVTHRHSRSSSSMAAVTGCGYAAASKDNSFDESTPNQQGRTWHSTSCAAVQAGKAAELKQKLQAAQRAKSLTVEFPCSPDLFGQHCSQQQQLAQASLSTSSMPAAAAATNAAISRPSPKSKPQSDSLRSLSARLSPVLSPRADTQRAAGVMRDSSSSSDSEITALGASAVRRSCGTANAAAVAAAWADVAGGQRISKQQSSSARRSIAVVLEGSAATAATLSPCAPQQLQCSPGLRSWGTTDAANTPSTFGALLGEAAGAASSSGSRVGLQQQMSPRGHQPAAADLAVASGEAATAAAMLARAERVSTLSVLSSPLPTCHRSAVWFDRSSTGSPIQQQQRQSDTRPGASRSSSMRQSLRACEPSLVTESAAAGSRAAGRQLSRHVSLSTGSLKAALTMQRSLMSLGAAVLPDVPMEVQLSFLGLSRAQRLSRRWLLVKAWSRWQQLLQVSEGFDRSLCAPYGAEEQLV